MFSYELKQLAINETRGTEYSKEEHVAWMAAEYIALLEKQKKQVCQYLLGVADFLSGVEDMNKESKDIYLFVGGYLKKHEPIKFKNWDCCRECGIILNGKNKDNFCLGKVAISLRADSQDSLP